MAIGVVRETFPGERRVALTPAVVAALAKQKVATIIESNAGVEAGFIDAEYAAKGGTIVADRREVFAQADVLCQVRCLGANPAAGRSDLPLLRPGQVVLGLCDALTASSENEALAGTGA